MEYLGLVAALISLACFIIVILLDKYADPEKEKKRIQKKRQEFARALGIDLDKEKE